MHQRGAVDRLVPTRRPQLEAQGTQRWHRLLFSHWEVPAEVFAGRLHPRLTLDTFDGKAFVGVVAFTMQRVKPFSFLPRIPTATTFFEINVRTYVHCEGGEPGVVFFSLDASSTLAVLAARTFWRVPYHRATISTVDDGGAVKWACDRRWPGPAMSGFKADFEVGEALAPSQPGSLEFFLAERYQFYVWNKAGALWRARVHHAPYPLHAVPRALVTPALVEAAGFPSTGARTADFFSPGVDVEVFSFERVP